jgi:hypothetical protein
VPDDLDVPIGAEPARHLLDDAQQYIDAEAHIGRPDNRDMARRLAHHVALFGRQPGGADDHRLAKLGGERGMLGGRRRRGELQYHVADADQLVDGLADRDPDPPDTGEFADVLVDITAARRLAAAGDATIFGRRDLGDQHPSHSAAASDDADLGLCHLPPPAFGHKIVTDCPAKDKRQPLTNHRRNAPVLASQSGSKRWR